jgi:hypothetical protein
MSGFLCSMVGASFTVAAVAQVLRSKKGITAVGNAQVDTAQSKFGGSSYLSDGTGDYLLVENLAGDITGDFTFECWVRFNSLPASNSFHMFVTGDGNRYFGLLNNSGTYRWESSLMTGSNQYVARYTPTITTGVWYHIALIKSGSTLTFYQDGTSYAGSTIAGSMTSTSTLFVSGTNILGAYTSANYSLNGWLDEVRISNSVRYTTGFTPSTTAFVNDANTVFLMHANGTDAATFFEDDNGVRSSTSLIATGAAKVSTTQNKFGGSSANFDGTSNTQVLVRSWNTSSYTGDFTIEGWFYITDKTTSTNARVWSDGDGSTTEDFRLLQFEYNTNQIYLVTGQSGNDSWNYSYVSATLNINTWYHIAGSRSGSSLRIFVNGTQQGSTISNSLAFTTASSNHSGRLGMFRTDASRFRGFIDDFRISNSARYTTTFTPSTTPFVNDANTLLLIHADGTNNSTVFRDDNGAREPKGIQANGNAQISTAQSKFGGASALFDGTGDYLTIPYNLGVIKWNQTSYTIEYWIRFSDLNKLSYTDEGVVIPNAVGNGNANNTQTYWSFGPISTGVVRMFYYNGGFVTVSTTGVTLSTNTWYHLAMVHSSGTIKIYVDGTERASASVSGTPNFTAIGNLPLNIGHTGTNGFTGYIDEIRVSDTARYTAAFTPSTTPFQSDANTVLLIHADGTNASTAFFDDNGIAPYTP